jgi:hypothetical protein
MILAFLLAFVLSLAKGTTQMKWDPLGHSIDVIGAIWFFVICMALFAAQMASIPRDKLKPVIAAVSAGPIICGIVVTSMASDYQHFLNGVFFVLFGLSILIAFGARDRLARYAPF